MITKDSKYILVADDSLLLRTRISDILVEGGHRVKIAKNGKEAIEEVRIGANGIDLLILDLQMPEVDGFGVLDWIKSSDHRGKFPILVMTGAYEVTQILERLKGLGASGHMSKDMSPEQIIFRVNRLLFPKESSGRPKSDRVCTSIPVDFIIGERSFTGHMFNASEGGAFLHSKIKIPQGTELKLKFSLPGYGRIMVIKGNVQWSSDETASSSLFCGHGVKFSSISMEDRKDLIDFIAHESAKLD
ncbi:MAG: response regulator [Deltaproteobacteria bacterium]|nr:response regulator [Deltaproteobacteria bacterium]